jgi:signal transduction histidine kinase/CheY-like chemotaxis protein
MNKNKNINNKNIENIKDLDNFKSIILDGISKISKFDKALFLLQKNNTLQGDNVSLKIYGKEKSIMCMAVKSSFAITINDIDNSFIYNQHIDNPLKFTFSNMMIIPLFCDDVNNTLLYTIILYKFDKNNPFRKEENKSIENYLHTSHNILLSKHRKLICQNWKPKQDIPVLKELKQNIDKQQQFFSSTIHDIRTPINSIMGFLELLKLEEENSTKKEYIDLAFKSSQTVTTLINDVLDMSKIEAGKLDINIQFISIVHEFEDLSLLFSYMTKKKNINFVVCYDPILPYIIRTDIDRIKQIIGNLLSNAIKFTPIDGFIEFKIKYDKNRDKAIISIRDNGIGISKENQEHIFSPFRQASKDTSSNYGGTGLGLSISKKLVELLGGELKLESSEGKGSKFYFEIPCDTVPYTPETIDNSRFKDISINIFSHTNKIEQTRYNIVCKYFDRLNIKYNKVESKDIKILDENSKDKEVFIMLDFNDREYHKSILNTKKRLIVINDVNVKKIFLDKPNISIINTPIKLSLLFDQIENNIILRDKIESIKSRDIIFNILIIDDNMINLKLMGEIIKKLGHKPFLFEKGRDSLDIITNSSIDIAFIDQHMPDVTGDVLIAEIKEKDENIAIYGLTGSSDKDIENKMLNAGALSVLIKPIHIDKIVEILDKNSI